MTASKLTLCYTVAFAVSLLAAVETTSYYKEKKIISLREDARNASYTVDDTIDSYNNTMQSLYAFYRASDYVKKTEFDDYINILTETGGSKKDAILYYGFNDYKNSSEGFFISSDKKSAVTASDIPTILRDNDKNTLSLQKIMDKKGTIFLILDTKKLESSLTAGLHDVVRGVDISIATAQTPVRINPDKILYERDFSLGQNKIHLYYVINAEWNKFSLYFPALLAFVAVFLAAYFFISGFFKMTDKAESSEHAKDAAERKFREQNAFFNQIIENIPGILFIKDARNDYKFYMVNKAAEVFFGVPREQLIGNTDTGFFTEEESRFFKTIDESTMASGKVVDIPCELVTTKSGEMFCHTRKFPIYDEDGKPQYLIGLSEDITKRKRNEMELADYRQNLELMVDERTEKLKTAIIKAEEANRLKSEFLATMSHEIRSPMSGVLGMAELLLDTPLSTQQKSLTKTILNSGEVLMNIIEDILDFSKIEADKLELDPVAVNMLELVDDVSMLYSTKARDKALELAVRYIPGSETFVYADPMRIRQVLGNLINNAIKFTESGYVIVTVREDLDTILPPDKVNLIFTIEDSGIGIAESDQEKIFEKFSQVNSSATRDHGGTGLGLSICRKLIEMMGGDITLKSELGKGSVFEFNLPMLRNQTEVFIQSRPPVLKDLKLLIVDDFPVIRAALSEQLGNAGLSCETAEGGQDALAKLVQARDNGTIYDMIIIDYLMPGMNGEMLARAINDEPDFRHICLVMLTAAGNQVAGDEYANKGFSAYISKPVSYLKLIDTLAVVWQKYKEGNTDCLIRVDAQSLGQSQKDEQALKLDGSKILLVEDSRLNQAFAEEVLSQLACHVTTVSNGQEAVEAVQREQFDLILMDCQMPVMDGFEAATRIRALKDKGIINQNLPIIALTANAMKGDKQRCIEAGMDDYISKPVRKKELKEKIFAWLGHAVEDPLHEDPIPVPPADPMTLLDHDILQEAKLILKDKFDYMVDCYIEDIENYIHEIQEAVMKHDLNALVRPAHTIKSTSKRMGALQLSDIARQIETSAKDVANTNIQGVWDMSPLMDNIRSIPMIFEETRDSLLKTRVRN